MFSDSSSPGPCGFGLLFATDMMKHTLQSVAAFLFFATILVAGAVPAYADVYQPGATLDPNCFPIDPNCYVEPPLVLSAATTSIISIASSFIATSTSASTFPYASTTAISVSGGNATTSGLTLGVVNGVLRAVAGVVQATFVNLASDVTGVLGIGNGGTGISTAPSYGQLLVGTASGGYALVSTSSLGIASGATPAGTTGQLQFNSYGALGSSAGLTFATSSGTLSATAGSFGSVTVSSTSTASGLSAQFATVVSGVVNTISSTFASITNATVGTLTATSSLTVLGSTSLQNASTTQLSVSGPSWFSGIANLASAAVATLTSGNATIGTLAATSSLSVAGTSALATTTIAGTNTFTTGSGLATFGGNVTINGLLGIGATTTMSNVLDMSSNRIIDVATPISTNDAANKSYVDAMAQGMTWQSPVIAIATSTTPLSAAAGNRYIINDAIPATVTSCSIGKIAQYNGSSWSCLTPGLGWTVYVTQESTSYNWNGALWVSVGSTVNHDSLNDLQGGQPGQYYHLNQADYNNVHNINAQLAQLLTIGSPSFQSLTLTGTTSGASMNVSGLSSLQNATATQFSVSGPSWFSGLANLASAAVATLAGSNATFGSLAATSSATLASTTATGLTISNNGLTITSSSPLATANTLYNISGTLYWGGSALGLANVNNGTTLGDMPIWDGMKWSRSGGVSYATSTSLFNVNGTASSTNLIATNASTSQLSVPGLSWLATTTVTGLAISNNGLTIASSTPAATLNSLYNLGGVLYWNGNAIKIGAENFAFAQNYGATALTGSSTMPWWSQGALYASSTLTVAGQTSLQNASTTQLSVSGPSWFNGLVTISNSTVNTANAVSISTNALTTGSALSVTSSYASGNSTNGLLYVANTGAVTNGIIGRIQSNSTAGSGLTVWANGGVGINTSVNTSNALSVMGNVDLGNIPGRVNFNGAFLAYGGTGLNSYGMDLGYNSATSRYSTRLFTPTSADIVFANIPTSTLPPSQASTTPMMTIRGDTGYVGIGTSAPYTALHVVGQALLSGSANRLMLAKNDGSDPAASTVWMLDNDVPSGLFRIFTEPTYGSTGVVRFALNTSSGYMNVTLGSAISSTGVCYGSGSAGLSLLGTCSSDARLKTNVQDLAATSGLSAIMQLRPVSFDWRDATSSLQGTQTGFIAQELDPVLPGVIGIGGTTTITLADGSTQTITDTRSINYNALWAPTILAIQQLAAQNASTTLALTGTTTPGLAFVSTTTAEQSFESSWFAGILRSFLASVTNGIDTVIARVFKAQEVDTQQLCVTDSSGAKTCITKDQLDALLSSKAQAASASGSGGGGGSSTPDAVTLSINGDNPATIFVGSPYQDLGAAITSPASAQNLGIKASVDGGAPTDMSAVTIDTSAAGDHTITYLVVDQTGATTTAERIVHVVAQSGSNQTATTSSSGTDSQSAGSVPQNATSTHNQ